MQRKNILMTIAALTAAAGLNAQSVVHVGKGSYASYTPLINCKSTRHAIEWGTYKGDQSNWMQRRKLYITEREGQPIPTNDWWTNLITEQYSGHLWSYPQMVQATADGVDVQRPSFWIDNGTEVKSNTILSVGSTDFAPESAVADSWHDWDVEFIEKDGSKQMKTTLAHGMPFTWIELKGLNDATLKLANSGWTDKAFDTSSKVQVLDASGNAFVSGSTASQLIMAKGGDYYAIFLPQGTEVTNVDGKVTLRFNSSKRYVIVGELNQLSDMPTLAKYAYSEPRKTTVSWNYLQKQGKMQTFWKIDGESLNGGNVSFLQGFMPHQYRDTGNDGMLTFNGITYLTPHGTLKLSEGNSFEVDYNFYGMLPYWGVPTDTTGVANPFSASKMETLINFETTHQGFGSDTYWGGKSLTQLGLNMMMAREMGDSANFVADRDKLKAALINWYTYTPGEENMFFARYDRWGGLVGYNTSYDSDTFNDHHFHYGYFTLASALLALVDKDFRDNYGQMARLLAKDYANWDHNDTAYPFFRTLDPWAGHSFAGGMGDGNGNGQESTSEAMQGWGGMYLLGVALDDKDMRDAGLFGWLTEARGTAEYWFDRHTDPNADYTVANYHQKKTDGYNIDYSKFSSGYTDNDGNQKTMIPPYNSNLTCHGVGYWTYFGWDAIYMQGIQWMPISPALDYLSENKAFAAWDYKRMMQDKLIGGWTEAEKNKNGWLGGSGGWGNVTLSYLQRSDPDEAARIFDELYDNPNSEFAPTSTVGTNGVSYFVTHSHRSHGDLDWTVTSDYPTARAFNKNGTKTYQIFNPTDAPLTVTFSTGYSHTVPAHEMFISDAPNRKAVPYIETTAPVVDLRDSVGMENLAYKKPYFESGHENAGTEPQFGNDGDLKTRWGSLQEDNQWYYVDLGKKYKLFKAKIYWEAAYASEYKIQVSDNATDWKDVKDVISAGGTDEIKLDDAEGRYVRILGVKRGTAYGISFYEFEVYGESADAAPDDIIGLKITADRDVLKENEPSQLSVVGLTHDRQWKQISPSDVAWSSEQGSVTNNGVYTPNTFDMVTVNAKYGDINLRKQFAVEEARLVQKFSMTPHDATIAIPDGKQQFGYVATDQFIDNATKTGAEMDVDNSKVAVKLYAVNGKDTVAANPNDISYDLSTRTLQVNDPGEYVMISTYSNLNDTVSVHAKKLTDFNLALNKPTTATSANGNSFAILATDGDAAGSRWESKWDDPAQSITVDLKDPYVLNRVRVKWEAAFAKKYNIEISMDGQNWTKVGDVDVPNLPADQWVETAINGQGRYVRINCEEKALTAYGYSIYEFEVYGTEKIATSIKNIEAEVQNSDENVYNLAGQKVNAKSAGRGVYVSKGHKWIK